ncbi:MAG TPA: hypothetical protein VEK11_01490 [Thermoanaerobaculia bacterium]|nr:hypothetical protein [Thermoanaerobaculia bacterium]
MALTKARAEEIKGELGLEAGGSVGLPAYLSWLLTPKIEAKGKAGGSVGTQSSVGDSQTTIRLPIHNAERQLQDLVSTYLQRYPKRFFFPADVRQQEWQEATWIRESPRPLVFLSLPGAIEAEKYGLTKTKLVPAAAEFENGKIVALYKQLDFGREKPPKYPDPADPGKEHTLVDERKEYWAWFDKNFDPRAAMHAVEDASREHGRIHWIAYRLPLNNDGSTLRLHICPRGAYATGDFAYNLIARGYKHGLRLVGTLKSEPDMNVLAIYER